MGSNLFGQLFFTLSAEMGVYAALLEVSLQKAAILAKNDIETLDELLSREMALQDERDIAAQERAAASQALARFLGLADDASLREFIGNAPADQGTRLEALRVEFSRIMKDLSTQNQANQKVILAEIDNIGVAIEFMSKSTVLGNNYNRYGAAEDTVHRVTLLDTSV